VYFASLEHMTHHERPQTLRSAWAMLKPGTLLCVADTPNRLWYYDDHTALTNFFHWLPDEIAMEYAARVPRPDFNRAFLPPEPPSAEKLARWGRGVSYHDFELAIGSLAGLCVAGEWEHRRRTDPG